MKSPEEAEHYACPSCGNTRFFVGYDDRGYPGHDECECGKNICECEVTLRQYFTVHEGGSIDYQAFEGGGRGAEIGSYTRIRCAACEELIWAPTPEDDPRPEITQEDDDRSDGMSAATRLSPKSMPNSRDSF
jgi:hypothetical protein